MTVKERNQLITDNMPLVYYVCRKYRHCDVPFEDLVQEAALGLMQAAKKFDPKKGRLGSYAYFWILTRIQKLVLRDKIVRIPFRVQQARRNAGEDPIGICGSLDDMDELPGGDGDGFEKTVQTERREQIERLLRLLKKGNREILKMRFGIGEYGRPKTLEEIGKVYGLTKERIRQIVESSLGRLAKYGNSV